MPSSIAIHYTYVQKYVNVDTIGTMTGKEGTFVAVRSLIKIQTKHIIVSFRAEWIKCKTSNIDFHPEAQ